MAMLPLLGPGSAAYKLPPTLGYDKHDVRKQRMPSYTFGKVCNRNANTPGGGPASYTFAVTKYGQKYSPAYSFGMTCYLPLKNPGIGPAGYSIDKHFKGRRAPIYSMGAARKDLRRPQIPGPDAYSVSYKPIRPSKPAYTMGLITTIIDKRVSPGPAAYGAVKNRTVLSPGYQYSMAARFNGPIPKPSPGPNAYGLAGYKPGDRSPTYSLGVRHHPRAPPMIVDGDNVC